MASGMIVNCQLGSPEDVDHGLLVDVTDSIGGFVCVQSAQVAGGLLVLVGPLGKIKGGTT